MTASAADDEIPVGIPRQRRRTRLPHRLPDLECPDTTMKPLPLMASMFDAEGNYLQLLVFDSPRPTASNFSLCDNFSTTPS